jgi:hypothetical protein
MIVRLTDVKNMLVMGAVRVVVLVTVVVENYACSEPEVQFEVRTERFRFGGTTLPRTTFSQTILARKCRRGNVVGENVGELYFSGEYSISSCRLFCSALKPIVDPRLTLFPTDFSI